MFTFNDSITPDDLELWFGDHLNLKMLHVVYLNKIHWSIVELFTVAEKWVNIIANDLKFSFKETI
jgi:hypothetical protein